MRLIFGAVIGLALVWWIWRRYSSAVQDDPVSRSSDHPTSSGGEPFEEPGPSPQLTPEPKPDASSKSADAGGVKPRIKPAIGDPDDLTRIKGIGPKLSELCYSLGVMRFDQIAAWSDADVAEVDQHLRIKGRIERDRWVDQAKLLAAGDDTGHAEEFG